MLTVLGLAVAMTGCLPTTAVGTTPTSASSSTSSTTVSTSGSTGTRTTTQDLHRAELALAGITGVEASEMKVVAGEPDSPAADVIVEWEGGRAEIDDTTGTVYVASMAQAAANTLVQFMTEDRLELEALRMVRELGWPDGMVAGLGFRQDPPGTLDQGSGLYTITWSQYDSRGRLRDGSIVLKLEGRTAALVSFSAWLGSDAPNIAGTIAESAALQIAQTEIYLRTDDPKISLAGDGSLILLNRSVSEELKVITDSKIVKTKPRLCWVITMTGTVDLKLVGGTVYMDAATGEVLKYQAVKASEPVTTSSLATP